MVTSSIGDSQCVGTSAETNSVDWDRAQTPDIAFCSSVSTIRFQQCALISFRAYYTEDIPIVNTKDYHLK